MSKSVRSIRLFDEDWEELQKMAEREEMTRSKFVREAALSGLPKRGGMQMRSGMIGDVTRLVGKLSKTCNLLRENGHEAVDDAEIAHLIGEVDAVLDEL